MRDEGRNVRRAQSEYLEGGGAVRGREKGWELVEFDLMV